MTPEEIEQYRHECEVREIAGYPLDLRRAYLKAVERARGQEAADRLRDGLTKLWRERKGS